MLTDPFLIKQYPKWHSRRLAFVLRARLLEKQAQRHFDRYAFPSKVLKTPTSYIEASYQDTAVTPLQMEYLVQGVLATECFQDTVIVEIGCYRGVTTRIFSQYSTRGVIAVDPFIGYGGSDRDYRCFKTNIEGLNNITHERRTSGEAFRQWKYGPISFIFIDAVHDYVNSIFDIQAWSSLVIPGGIIALHDVDQYAYAGTRQAAFEMFSQAEIFAHPENLLMVLA